MIRVSRGDDSRNARCCRRGRPLRRGPEHSPHRRRAEVQAGAGEHPGDASRAHGGTQRLQTAHEVGDEVREAVDRLADLDEGVRPLLVESAVPGRDGEGRHEEVAGRLGERPAPRRPQFENGESLDGRVVRPALRRDALHPRVLDAQLLAEERDFLAEPVVLLGEAGPGVPGVGGVAAGGGQGEPRQGDRVEGSGPDASGPPFRQGDDDSGVARQHAILPTDCGIEPCRR